MFILLFSLSLLHSQLQDKLVDSLEKGKYQELLKLNPRNSYEIMLKALALAKLSKTTEASRNIEKIRKPYPQGYYYTKGVIYLLHGNYQEAEKNLKYSILRNEYITKSRIELGKLEKKRGNYDKAIHYWVGVLNSNKLSETTQDNLHLLIAESMYIKYRYLDSSDSELPKDAIYHIDAIKNSFYKEKARELYRNLQSLKGGYIVPEDLKDLELSLDINLALISTPTVSFHKYIPFSYFRLNEDYILTKILANAMYTVLNTREREWRLMLGMDFDTKYYTGISNINNLGNLSAGLSSKLQWMAKNRTSSVSLSYKYLFQYTDIHSLKGVSKTQNLSLNLETLFAKNFYLYFSLPLVFYPSFNTSFYNTDELSLYGISLGTYYINSWINTGVNFAYLLSSYSLFDLNLSLAFVISRWMFGTKYIWLNMDTMTDTQTKLFINYSFSGAFLIQCIFLMENNSVQGNSTLFGMGIKLKY